MSKNRPVVSKTDFIQQLGIPVDQKLAAAEYNANINWMNQPVQLVAGSLADTNIVIDGTKSYATTIAVAGATRTITAALTGHTKGNNIKQRYTFAVDCTITLVNFDATGNNTGDITPITAGTYDFQYFSNENGINLEILTNIANEASPKTEPNSWYVNIDYDGSNGESIGSDKKPFTNLQNTITNVASAGDNIYFNGKITGNITVDKSISLIGLKNNEGKFNASLQDNLFINADCILDSFDVIDATTVGAGVARVVMINVYCSNWFNITDATTIISARQCRAIKFEIGTSSNLINCWCDIMEVHGNATLTNTIVKGDCDVFNTTTLTMWSSSISGDLIDNDTACTLIMHGGSFIEGTNGANSITQLKGNVSADKLAANVAAQLNALDVTEAAIGSGYGGIMTAPIDGAIIEGDVVIGGSSSSGDPLEVHGNITTIGAGSSFSINGWRMIARSSFYLSDVDLTMYGRDAIGTSGKAYLFSDLTGVPLKQIQAGSVHIAAARDTDPPLAAIQDDGGGFFQQITQNELSADPSDPSEGQSVTWQSDGTGSGDDGDIMMKITAGGTTKTTTLVDFSAI